MLSIFTKKKNDDIFFHKLAKYSCHTENMEYIKEWIILFKEKCPQNKQCICEHYIRNYAYVYNVLNGNIVIIGLGCCKKNGINEIATNLVLLEFLTETDAGSLILKNGSFDINNDIDFIAFINTKFTTMNNMEKENVEFYIRKMEILKKNIVELIDIYHFYSGQIILQNIDDILLDFIVQSPLKNIDDLLLDLEEIPAEVPVDVVQDVPADVVQDVPADVVQDVPADVVQYVPADVVQYVPADVVQDVPTDVVQDVPADVVQDVPTDVVQNVPADVVQDVPVEVIEYDMEEILAKKAIKCTMDKILIQLEYKEDTYNFRDPSLNELSRRADKTVLRMKLNNCEYEYLYFEMNYSLQKIRNK